MHVVSHAITYDNKRFSASDGLRVFANTSPLISTTGINRGLDHVKCVEVLVRRSSPVRKLASTVITVRLQRNYDYVTLPYVAFILSPTVFMVNFKHVIIAKQNK